MSTTTKYTISGTIYDEYNSPISKARLLIYQVDLRNEELLMKVYTNARGYYKYTFKFPNLNPKSEIGGPDICIAINKTGSQSIVDKSPIYFNIQPETTIDYRIGGGAILPINEFDRLVALLTPLLEVKKLNFDQLEETNKNKDISFLSGETGEPFDAINALSQAHRLLVSTKIDAELYYALLRMGFPSDLGAILDVQSDIIRKAIEQAVNENIISSKFLKILDGVIEGFNLLATKQLKEGSSEKLNVFKKPSKIVLPNQKD